MNTKVSLRNAILRMTLIFALVSSWTPPALAFEDSPFSMFIAGAYPLAIGPTHHWMGGEYGITGGIGYKEESWPVGLQFEGMTYRFGFNDQAEAYANSEGYMQITAGTANLTWVPKRFDEENVKPRFISGIGIYNRVTRTTETRLVGGSCWDPWYGYYPCTGTDDIVTHSNSQTKMGFNVGAMLGYELMGGQELFMEVRYHHILTSGYATQFLPLNFGIRW